MSLPINKTFSPVPEINSFEEVKDYLQKLKFELEDNYQNQTQNINGFIRNSEDVDGSKWVPYIEGANNAGSPTYTVQNGFVIRSGIVVTYWFNIAWTSLGGATGNLRNILPYKVTKTPPVAGKAFIGAVMSSGLTYTGGRTHIACTANYDQYHGNIVATGSGLGATNISIQSNASISGNITYIGVEDE